MPSLGGIEMAFIKFGKKEIEALETNNKMLRIEIEKMKNQCEELNTLVIEKDKEINSIQNQVRKLKGQVGDIEKIKNENKVLRNMLEHSNRHTKSTVKNLEIIARLKAEGKSYRAIAKALSEATGDDFAHSTVSYLYAKYIKK